VEAQLVSMLGTLLPAPPQDTFISEPRRKPLAYARTFLADHDGRWLPGILTPNLLFLESARWTGGGNEMRVTSTSSSARGRQLESGTSVCR
jgi:hypothetical protein